MTIYLLEIMGLGLILFFVAMVWQESEAGSGKSTNKRRYRLTLEEGDYISFLQTALDRAQSQPPAEPQRKTSEK